MVGDWMGSIYDVGGRYERTVRTEPNDERRDTGRWEHDEAENVLRLVFDTPDPWDRRSGGWSVLSVATCETSNVMLVLHEIILGSRNLPIVLYRVHCNGRGYGT